METRNSSPVEGAPKRVAMAAMDGDTPGIQAITDPPRLPSKTDLAREPAGMCRSVSFCSGMLVPEERLIIRKDAPKSPESRGSMGCGSKPRGDWNMLSWLKAKVPRKPLVKKTKTAMALYFKWTSDPWPSITGPFSVLIMNRAMTRSRTPTYFIKRSL